MDERVHDFEVKSFHMSEDSDLVVHIADGQEIMLSPIWDPAHRDALQAWVQTGEYRDLARPPGGTHFAGI